MQRLALVITFTLGTICLAFAQAPAADDHSAHHPAQETAPPSQPLPIQPGSGTPTRGMMQGMMQMMQGMQGMMRTMHQQAQSDQKQPARPQAMQDCSMMPRSDGTTADATTMQAMMQMMQGMMQMMQSQMQSGQTQAPH